MTTRTRGRAGIVAGAVALASIAFAMRATPTGAATTNPCKVLTRSEIQAAFGGTVGTGRKGFSTAVSAQCEYGVGANADRPAGTVTVHVMTTGAKAAYNGLKKQRTYVPIDDLPNSLSSDKAHVVDVLKGDVLVAVQGGFVITDPLPIHFYDDKT